MMALVSPGEPALRLARATAFALVCVVVSAGGHLFAGGGAIPPGVLLAGGAGALALAYGFNGRERGLGTVLAVTISAQAVLHELFTLAAPVPELHAGHGRPSVGMVLVHGVVAWLTGWWLHRGESALWLVLRLWAAPSLGWARRLPLGTAVTPPAVRPAVPDGQPVAWSPWERTAAVHLRGPPCRRRAG
ncbi:hypothetical protein [Thermoactinospora rubra]|uniref:hypothetical protein n=1 Tax=Thermoactinospora rubra TaxID=1088767 RepID=UPI000A0F6EF7|nr:hypothetical protein [Thermoactinospora rubra]